MSPENDSRLLLIEDPFGHIGKSENYIQIRDKIEGLIRDRLSINRKVIITSRLDILLDVFRKSRLKSAKFRVMGGLIHQFQVRKRLRKYGYDSMENQMRVCKFLKD